MEKQRRIFGEGEKNAEARMEMVADALCDVIRGLITRRKSHWATEVKRGQKSQKVSESIHRTWPLGLLSIQLTLSW